MTSIREHIRHTRRVYANHKRIIDLDTQYDTSTDPATKAVIADQVVFLIDGQLDRLAASRLARTVTFLPAVNLREARREWLARSKQAWADATNTAR